MDNAFDFSRPVAIGADHAGYAYKEQIVDYLKRKGIPYKDYGTYSEESADYPDFAHPVAGAVQEREASCGILVCGSGNGVAITANKYKDVRAALCWEPELAQLSREHNNANVICLPQRFVSMDAALHMVETFLNTEFMGGRHATRVGKITSC